MCATGYKGGAGGTGSISIGQILKIKFYYTFIHEICRTIYVENNRNIC